MKTICPVCGKSLEKKNTCAVCENGHTFDFAKEGYLYLLKPNSKNSHNPGDNKLMVGARRDFLDGDFYKPLAMEIANQINARMPHPITLVDAGVGTGYYLQQIMDSRSAYNDDCYLATDISKFAVRVASKRLNAAECCVASVYEMPYENECADVITCVFSPYAMSEYSRVLKDDGILIVANPNENHLIELRQALYENVRRVETPLPHDGFDIVDKINLTFKFTLDNAQIGNLLTMTPYVYRAPIQSVERTKLIKSATFTADFCITILKKTQR